MSDATNPVAHVFAPSRRLFIGGTLAAAALPSLAKADTGAENAASFGARQIPARVLPVPSTVSSALRAQIAAPYPPEWNAIPQTAADLSV